jgi:hypothetical protein
LWPLAVAVVLPSKVRLITAGAVVVENVRRKLFLFNPQTVAAEPDIVTV